MINRVEIFSGEVELTMIYTPATASLNLDKSLLEVFGLIDGSNRQGSRLGPKWSHVQPLFWEVEVHI